ncbi:MAG: GTP 3',8-cyclase MoaA [Chthonomonadales bacterium]
MLVDSFGRTIDYLRISVTDRCNFRCVYCMPESGADIAPRDEILTFEEIGRLARIAADLGIRKVRITGGEPLVRKDIVKLVEMIGNINQFSDISLTTNGFLLAGLASDLHKAGLNRVNVSLDTLHPDRFKAIARRGNLSEVMAGIETAENVGMVPMKINCVVMRGQNDDEVAAFAEKSVTAGWHVRFIELMPINWSSGDGEPIIPGWSGDKGTQAPITLYANTQSTSMSMLRDALGTTSGMLNALDMRNKFVSSAESRQRIEAELGPLVPATVITNGPARTFRIPGATGTVGFISQISNDFCKNCNRLRLTADGQLRPCLMADGEVDLKTPLRSGASDEDIADLFRMTVFHKPFEHRLEDGLAPTGRGMSRLGG